MTPTADQTVREIALENPASVRVFETLGIDYCCGGRRSLRDACAQADVPEERVMALLATLEPARDGDSGDWIHVPFAELTAWIVNHHHDFVRRESPRLTALAEKVAARHGQAHPELKAIRECFTALAGELSTHMLREEQVLFPYLNALDAVPAPVAFFGPVRNPIAQMVADHDGAGALLGQISDLSGRFQAPADGCPSYIALYRGLEEFERDLHQHVHLENNVLFARALEMEE